MKQKANFRKYFRRIASFVFLLIALFTHKEKMFLAAFVSMWYLVHEILDKMPDEKEDAEIE